jgi:hypothetical protein
LEKEGISVRQTQSGLQLTLEGDFYKDIARKWENGEYRPFYSLLKEFIKALESEYSV